MHRIRELDCLIEKGASPYIVAQLEFPGKSVFDFFAIFNAKNTFPEILVQTMDTLYSFDSDTQVVRAINRALRIADGIGVVAVMINRALARAYIINSSPTATITVWNDRCEPLPITKPIQFVPGLSGFLLQEQSAVENGTTTILRQCTN